MKEWSLEGAQFLLPNNKESRARRRLGEGLSQEGKSPIPKKNYAVPRGKEDKAGGGTLNREGEKYLVSPFSSPWGVTIPPRESLLMTGAVSRKGESNDPERKVNSRP